LPNRRANATRGRRRPYPEGYWTGVSYGLDVAGKELQDVVDQFKED
jgi:hypothetical protein